MPDKNTQLSTRDNDYKALSTLKGQDPKEIINEYLNGKSGPEIAKMFGVTRQALSLWLIRHAETDWRNAQIAKALALRDEAEDSMEHAADVLELSRARERLKSSQWTLEKLLRQHYGQDVPKDLAGRVNISINLGAAKQQKGRVIEQDLSSEGEATDS